MRSANFDSEPRLVRVRAFARPFCAALVVALSSPPASWPKRSSASVRVYQTSRKRIVVVVVIVVRYAAAAARAAGRAPGARAPGATSRRLLDLLLCRLARGRERRGSRFRSHSNGAGSV